jgi:hypothetical protein
MLVPAVNQHVPRRHQRNELGHQLIHRLPRLDHHHDLAGSLDGFDELLEGMTADKLAPLGRPLQKLVYLLGSPIEDSHAKAAAFDVASEVFAHDGETD